MEIRRIRIVSFLLIVLMFVESVVLFFQSGIFPEVNNRADILKAYATACLEDIRILPGDIYDRNGKVVFESGRRVIQDKNDKGEVEEKTVTYKEYQNARAFSQLVGYTGIRSLDIEAKSTDQVVGERKDYRLMRFLDDDYWGENGLYSTVGLDGTKGQSAILTVDAGVQVAVYNALCKEMDSSEDTGSAVVLDVRTGEILAMVSLPAYDFNDLGNAIDEMSKGWEEHGLEPFFPVSYKNPQVPGSIFKILTAVALIDHGKEDFSIDNSAYTVNGWECKPISYHFSHISIDEGDILDLRTALDISSNIYFSRAALELGKDGLKETAEKFMLIEHNKKTVSTEDGNQKSTTGQVLQLDCGYVPYVWDLDVSEDILAQTGMGQGRTEITTLQAAMIMQAIANDGKMMKPYVIQKLVDEKGSTVYEGQPELLSEATSKETADIVTEMLSEAALLNPARSDMPDVYDLFEKYRVAGKTGTGEVAFKDQNGEAAITNNAWFVSFAPADAPHYVVVVNQCRTDKHGNEVMPVVAEIYRYLFEKR